MVLMVRVGWELIRVGAPRFCALAKADIIVLVEHLERFRPRTLETRLPRLVTPMINGVFALVKEEDPKQPVRRMVIIIYLCCVVLPLPPPVRTFFSC